MANSKTNNLPSSKSPKKKVAAKTPDEISGSVSENFSDKMTAKKSADSNHPAMAAKSAPRASKAARAANAGRSPNENKKESGFDAHVAPHIEEFALLNDREFKAHLYQQLVDLQPYFTTDSQVSVEVDQEAEDEIVLTLSTTWGENRIDVLGHGDDVYTALSDAKGNLLRQIEEWYSEAVDTRARDAEIHSIRDGSFLLH